MFILRYLKSTMSGFIRRWHTGLLFEFMNHFEVAVGVESYESFLTRVRYLLVLAYIAALLHFLQMLKQIIAKAQKLLGHNLCFYEAFGLNALLFDHLHVSIKRFFATAFSFSTLVLFHLFFSDGFEPVL